MDIGRVINEMLLAESSDKKMQKAVYEKVTKDFQATYEKYYIQLLREILRYLNSGFPMSARKNASARILVTNPEGADVTFIPNAGKGWEPLADSTIARKLSFDRARNRGKLSDRRTKEGKAGLYTHKYDKQGKLTARQKREAFYKSKLDKPVAPSASGMKFWVFRRNLAASAEQRIRPDQAKVAFTQKDVARVTGRGSPGVVKVTTNKGYSDARFQRDLKRASPEQLLGQKGAKPLGVVQYNKPITIGYTAGLKFSTLPTPLNELVRKPFIQGNSAGVIVYDSGADESRKKGIRVLAFVESHRPFIVELSGVMGKLARKRLGI